MRSALAEKATPRILAAIFTAAMGLRIGGFIAAVSLAIPGVPARAHGQSPPPLPGLPAVGDSMRPGTWVQYVVARPRTGQVMLVRLAALERERDGQWFEFDFTDSRRHTLSVKVLIEGKLQAPRRVARAIVQAHGQQPLELPARAAARQLPDFRQDPSKDSKLTKLGQARITVAAGAFTTQRYRLKDKGRTVEMWACSKVAGWPLVKLVSKDVQLELAAHGQGATSLVRGKPTKLDDRLLGGGGPASRPQRAGGSKR
jgi:hypothetical protein